MSDCKCDMYIYSTLLHANYKLINRPCGISCTKAVSTSCRWTIINCNFIFVDGWELRMCIICLIISCLATANDNHHNNSRFSNGHQSLNYFQIPYLKRNSSTVLNLSINFVLWDYKINKFCIWLKNIKFDQVDLFDLKM